MFSGARATTRRRLNVKEQKNLDNSRLCQLKRSAKAGCGGSAKAALAATAENTLQREAPVQHTHAL
jgi:hypothetical protein